MCGYEYDKRGHRTAISDSLGHKTEQRYETSHGWLVETIDPLGNRTRFDYDGGGRQIAQIDTLGAQQRTVYDGFGRVVTRIDLLGHRQTVAYNALDRVVRETNTLSQTTHYQYDSLNRLLVMTDTLGFATRYSYDDAGRQIAVIDPRGAVTRSTYDTAGRLTAIDFSEGTPDVSYVYDVASNVIIMTNGLGMTSYRGARSQAVPSLPTCYPCTICIRGDSRAGAD